MRYLKKFINELSDNIEVVESPKSNSVYYSVDGFWIRLSDHLQVIPNKFVKVDVVTLWKRKDFLVRIGLTNIPMVKTREEVKTHIKVMYENWLLEVAKAQSDHDAAVARGTQEVTTNEMCQVAHPIHFQACKTSEDFMALDAKYAGHGKGMDISAMFGLLPAGQSLSKPIRRYLIHQCKNKRMTVADMFAIAVANEGKITDISQAEVAVMKYLTAK